MNSIGFSGVTAAYRSAVSRNGFIVFGMVALCIPGMLVTSCAMPAEMREDCQLSCIGAGLNAS